MIVPLGNIVTILEMGFKKINWAAENMNAPEIGVIQERLPKLLRSVSTHI